MEMDNGIHVAFTPANSTSVLLPMDQGETSTFKSYHLRNSFCKAVASTDSGSSDGSGQSQLKTFWKIFTTRDAIKNMS